MQKLLPLILVLIIGCYRGSPSEDPPIHINPNMDDQPKYKAQAASEFFKNGSAMRIRLIMKVKMPMDRLWKICRSKSRWICSGAVRSDSISIAPPVTTGLVPDRALW